MTASLTIVGLEFLGWLDDGLRNKVMFYYCSVLDVTSTLSEIVYICCVTCGVLHWK